MARLIIETAGENVTIGGTDVEVIGTDDGAETITVTGGTVTFDGSFAAGGDTIAIDGEAEDYTATVNGSRLVLTSATGATISVPVGPEGVDIEFGGDDTRTLMVNAEGNLMFGDQEIAADGETELDPGTDEATTLTQALENLQEAQEALATYLAETELENDPTPATPTTEADIIAVRDAAEAALAADPGGSDAQLAADLSDAEDALDDAEADVAAVTGLSAAIDDLEEAQAEYQADIAAASQTYAALSGEVAAYNTLNDPDVTLEVASAEALSQAGQNDVIVSDGLGGSVIEVGADGTLVRGAAAPAASASFSALLADAQAAYDAALAMDASQIAFEEAIEDVLVAEGVAAPDGSLYYTEGDGELNAQFESDASLTDALFDARDAVEAAQAEVDERAELRQDLEDAQDMVDEVDDLNEAISDAEDAIEDLGYEVPVTVNNTADVDGTAENDIFILDTGATGVGSATIGEFNEDGDDILFVGSGYTVAELGATADLANTSQGDVNELEVFIRQEGTDTVLYFEDEAFSGNATNGFQGFTVTLEDVDADTVSLDATGYITVEETTVA